MERGRVDGYLSSNQAYEWASLSGATASPTLGLSPSFPFGKGEKALADNCSHPTGKEVRTQVSKNSPDIHNLLRNFVISKSFVKGGEGRGESCTAHDVRGPSNQDVHASAAPYHRHLQPGIMDTAPGYLESPSSSPCHSHTYPAVSSLLETANPLEHGCQT